MKEEFNVAMQKDDQAAPVKDAAKKEDSKTEDPKKAEAAAADFKNVVLLALVAGLPSGDFAAEAICDVAANAKFTGSENLKEVVLTTLAYLRGGPPAPKWLQAGGGASATPPAPAPDAQAEEEKELKNKKAGVNWR